MKSKHKHLILNDSLYQNAQKIMSLFRITGKIIRKPYIWFLYGCKTIGRHCGKSGWERFDFWGYTFTIISLWRKMSRSLIRLCKQYIIRVIFNATDIWVHSIIDLRVFTAMLYQKLLLLFVANYHCNTKPSY